MRNVLCPVCGKGGYMATNTKTKTRTAKSDDASRRRRSVNRFHNVLGIGGTCVALLAGASSLTAQASSPADSAAVLLGAAESFEFDGEWDVAEALYRFIAEHFDTTPAAIQARTQVDALTRFGVSGSGSVELRVWAATYGLWLGVAVPAWLGADQPEPYGAGLLLGGPAGYFGGKALAESLNLTEGQARAITFGGTWGTWQGFGWAEVFDLGSTEFCYVPGQCFQTGGSDEARFGAMVIGGLSGIAAGALLARRPISRGVASTANYGALWGTWFGVATSILMDFDEGDQPLTGALIGGNVGLLTTALLAPGWNISRNRARLVSIAGVIGGLGGLGLDLLFQPDDDKTLVAIPFATSLLGLAIGAVTTRDSDAEPVPPDNSLSSLSGALFQLDEGRFGVGFPTPTPTFIRVDVPWGGTALKPAAAFTLFAARF